MAKGDPLPNAISGAGFNPAMGGVMGQSQYASPNFQAAQQNAMNTMNMMGGMQPKPPGMESTQMNQAPGDMQRTGGFAPGQGVPQGMSQGGVGPSGNIMQLLSQLFGRGGGNMPGGGGFNPQPPPFMGGMRGPSFPGRPIQPGGMQPSFGAGVQAQPQAPTGASNQQVGNRNRQF